MQSQKRQSSEWLPLVAVERRCRNRRQLVADKIRLVVRAARNTFVLEVVEQVVQGLLVIDSAENKVRLRMLAVGVGCRDSCVTGLDSAMWFGKVFSDDDVNVGSGRRRWLLANLQHGFPQ